MTTYWCEYAWLPEGLVAGVLVEVAGERVARVGRGPAGGATRLAGLTLPGLANAHSHAFHRALRGATQRGRGDFWSWRERMYAVAASLDPDSYLRLATAVYAEMALAGITCVGEFHYLHHGGDGVPYDEPNEMGLALVEAARAAGLRIALLDACYLTGGVDAPLSGAQRRFGDGTAARWAERVERLAGAVGGRADAVVGAAVHSARAVPPGQLPVVAEFSRRHAAPLHAHVSEQRAENEACVERYAATPVRLLHEHGVLGPRSTAVHATHLTDADLRTLGESRTRVCMCPTTERDLADGIGPARRLFEHGSPLTLGSDSHAVIDLFEEARAVELNERLATGRRGHWSAAELLTAATSAGHASLGFPDAGRLVAGAWADLVSVRLDSVRTAGALALSPPGGPAVSAAGGVAADRAGSSAGGGAEAVVFAAGAADVHSVISSGRRIVADGHHISGDVGAMLADAIGAVR